MFRLIAISLILTLLLPAVLSLLLEPQEVFAQTNGTDVMQQSDHKRRATKQAKPEPVQQQTAGVIPIEADSGDGDYVVLGILVASVVILAFVATRRKKIRFKSRSRS